MRPLVLVLVLVVLGVSIALGLGLGLRRGAKLLWAFLARDAILGARWGWRCT